ncbi:trypsin-like serine peptidase [Arthrobacter sp. NPDC090010]|uniref:trypsin-like serine peptidase n=1 Tax=Arthrobacter sp. NPDC090010 TaxID=3363942 RepID=UPI00380AEE28
MNSTLKNKNTGAGHSTVRSRTARKKGLAAAVAGLVCLGATLAIAPPASASDDPYGMLVDGYRPSDQSVAPFAWAGKLKATSDGTLMESCSATLVGPHTIITDAHCLPDPDYTYTFYLQYNNGSSGDFASCNVAGTSTLAPYYINPKYNASSDGDVSYDWAIANLGSCNLAPLGPGKYPAVRDKSFTPSSYINMGYPYVDMDTSSKWNSIRSHNGDPLRSTAERTALSNGELLQTCGFVSSSGTRPADKWQSQPAVGIPCRLGSGSSGGGWLAEDSNSSSGWALVGVNGFDNNDAPGIQYTGYWDQSFLTTVNSYLS